MVCENESRVAEQELTKLRKLPKNKLCVNCRAPGTPLLTAVVVPFGTFVCSMCKSAHQAFSHRCKSSQMSLWTMDEVSKVDERNGGGNSVAEERYLRYVRDSDRPREGDRLERYKDFVERAYIRKEWAAESRPPTTREDRSARATPTPRAAQTRRETYSARDTAPCVPVQKVAIAAPTSPPAASADLLSFDAPTPPPPPSVPAAPAFAVTATNVPVVSPEIAVTASAAPRPQTTCNGLFDLFDPFMTATVGASPAAPPPAAAPTAVAVPPAPSTPSPSAFGFINPVAPTFVEPAAPLAAMATAFGGGAMPGQAPNWSGFGSTPAVAQQPWPQQSYAYGCGGYSSLGAPKVWQIGGQPLVQQGCREQTGGGFFADPASVPNHTAQHAKAGMRLEDLQQNLQQLYAAA